MGSKSLSELIHDCGNGFKSLTPHTKKDPWLACGYTKVPAFQFTGSVFVRATGQTPIEAVTNLLLKLKK